MAFNCPPPPFLSLSVSAGGDEVGEADRTLGREQQQPGRVHTGEAGADSASSPFQPSSSAGHTLGPETASQPLVN